MPSFNGPLPLSRAPAMPIDVEEQNQPAPLQLHQQFPLQLHQQFPLLPLHQQFAPLPLHQQPDPLPLHQQSLRKRKRPSSESNESRRVRARSLSPLPPLPPPPLLVRSDQFQGHDYDSLLESPSAL